MTASNEAPPPAVRVALSDIVRTGRFQVRAKMQEATVRAYATAMRAGTEFPPVTLARLGGALVLLDGFHRVQAATVAGHSHVPAVILSCSPEEAAWRAAEANLTHGLPLDKAAKRAAFRAFMRAKRYRKGGGALHSLRDISVKLAGIATHETLRQWMQKDFPSIARRYAGDERRRNSDGVRLKAEDVLAETADEAVAKALAAIRGHPCAALRSALVAILEDGFRAVVAGHPVQVLEGGAEVEPEAAF